MPSASSEFADLAAALGLGGVSGAIPAVLAVITHTPIVAACPPFVLDYFIAGDPETLSDTGKLPEQVALQAVSAVEVAFAATELFLGDGFRGLVQSASGLLGLFCSNQAGFDYLRFGFVYKGGHLAYQALCLAVMLPTYHNRIFSREYSLMLNVGHGCVLVSPGVCALGVYYTWRLIQINREPFADRAASDPTRTWNPFAGTQHFISTPQGSAPSTPRGSVRGGGQVPPQQIGDALAQHIQRSLSDHSTPR
jgi:hypothetical protein